MIDIKFLREQPDAVRASQRARGEDEGIVDAILTADERRRSSIAEFEALRAEQKSFGKQVAAAKGEQKAALVAAAKATSDRVKELQAAATAAGEELATLVRDEFPTSSSRASPAVARTTTRSWRPLVPPRDFAAEGFEPKDHLELAEGLDALDMARGAKVGGSRFYFLKGVGARLELARSTWRSPRRSRPGSPR